MCERGSALIDWTAEEEKALIVLWENCFTESEIAKKLDRSKGAIKHKIQRLRKLGKVKQRNQKTFGWLDKEFTEPVKVYDSYFKIDSNNIIIFGDCHIPYLNTKFTKEMFRIAKKYKTKDCLIAGDLFDQDMFSTYDRRDQSIWEDEKERTQVFLNHLLDQFNRLFIICGNHDIRILRLLRFEESFKGFMAGIITSQRVKVSDYPKALLNDSYWIIHPKSYSQISGTVAKRLAEKYHKNIVATHGHFTSKSYDRSGDYICVDCGGLVDYNKVEYVNYYITTHPLWNNSFVLIKNNCLRLYDREELRFENE